MKVSLTKIRASCLVEQFTICRSSAPPWPAGMTDLLPLCSINYQPLPITVTALITVAPSRNSKP